MNEKFGNENKSKNKSAGNLAKFVAGAVLTSMIFASVPANARTQITDKKTGNVGNVIGIGLGAILGRTTDKIGKVVYPKPKAEPPILVLPFKPKNPNKPIEPVNPILKNLKPKLIPEVGLIGIIVGKQLTPVQKLKWR